MKYQNLFVIPGVCFLLAIFFGCSDSNDANPIDQGDFDATEEVEAEENDDTTPFSAVTTLAATIVPDIPFSETVCPDADAEYCANPALSVLALSPFYSVQMGEWSYAEGEECIPNDAFSTNADTTGTRKSLFSFAQLTDTHLTDEESPSRNGIVDNPAEGGSLRPSDMFTEVVLDAAVKSINYFHQKHPFDLVTITGDVTDSILKTELEAFTAIMAGEMVHPDSGEDDDPVEGPNNDPQDDFQAAGLDQDLPWIVALGNHDSCMLGTSPIDESSIAMATGNKADFGTRNGKTFEMVTGEIPEDPERRPLHHTELIEQILNASGLPQGHGYTQKNIDDSKGYFVYDPDGDLPLRFIMLDTAYRPGPEGFTGMIQYADGVLDRDQFEDFLAPQLDLALEEKRLVIVMAHHALGSISNDDQPNRFADGEEIKSLLCEYENVLLFVGGHSHKHRIRHYENDLGTGGFYEVKTTSLIDWPQQFRFFEIVRNADATLSVFTVVVDYEAPEGSLPATSRMLSLIDVQSGWEDDREVEATDRNAELIWPIPASLQSTIDAWPEPKETLASQTAWKESE